MTSLLIVLLLFLSGCAGAVRSTTAMDGPTNLRKLSPEAATATLRPGSVPRGTYEPAAHMVKGFARIHVHRPDELYTGFGLHVSDDPEESAGLSPPMAPTGRDYFGLYWDIRLREDAASMRFTVHRAGDPDSGPVRTIDFATLGYEIWILTDSEEIFRTAPEVNASIIGDLKATTAFWITRDLIAWDVPPSDRCIYLLSAAPEGGLELGSNGVKSNDTDLLTTVSEGLSPELAERFPALRGYTILRLSGYAQGRVEQLLKGQVVITALGRDGCVRDASGLNMEGVVDDLFKPQGPGGHSPEATPKE